MAIYRCSINTFSRSKGQSAVAAAAYRARDRFTSEATGKTINYKNHSGLVSNFMALPKGQENPIWAKDPQRFWNEAEKAEKRINSTVAREFLISLPHEMTTAQRKALTDALCEKLVERFGFGVMGSIHAPDKDQDQRNHHVHILASTRQLTAEGFGAKTRELDEKKSGAVEEVREMVANVINEHLALAGIDARVDHRTLEAQHNEALEAGDLITAFLTDREAVPHVYKGKNWEEGKAKQAAVKAENIEHQKELITSYFKESVEENINRARIIAQLEGRRDANQEDVKNLISCYDTVSNLIDKSKVSWPFQSSFNNLTTVEKLFVDIPKDAKRDEIINQLDKVKTKISNELVITSDKCFDRDCQIKAYKQVGREENQQIIFFYDQAKQLGVNLSNTGINPIEKTAAYEKGRMTEGNTPLVSKLSNTFEQVRSSLTQSGSSQLMNQDEYRAIDSGKSTARNLPPSSKSIISNSLVSRLESAQATINKLEGQLRTCSPDQVPQLLGQIRQAEIDRYQAIVALEEAKGRAIADAQNTSQQAREMGAGQAFIPQVMGRINSKERS
ncbi:MAG: MobQ family relaxase [Pseudomonadota bacterium]